MRLNKKVRQRNSNYSGEAWATFLLSYCDRIGALVCFPENFHLLTKDDERDAAIRAAWQERKTELLARWKRERPGERPRVLEYLKENS